MYRLLRHEIKQYKLNFYFNILFKSQSQPCTDPLCTFFNQVLHMWYTVCLPGFMPTPFKKQYNSSQFTQKYQMILVSYVHPVLLSPYSACKLDVLGLQIDLPCVNGQQIGILHQAHHVIFRCFVESPESTLGPLHWALHTLPTLILFICNGRWIDALVVEFHEFPVCDFFNESV